MSVELWSDSKPANVVLAGLRGLIAVLAWAAWLALAFAVLYGCTKPEPMECQFVRQAGTMYLSDTRELAKSTSLVIVHRDGRQFAFRREDLLACQAVTP